MQAHHKWKRAGREWHGPCPVTGAGRDTAWVAEGHDGGVRIGCRHCGGRLSRDDVRDHLDALLNRARDPAPFPRPARGRDPEPPPKPETSKREQAALAWTAAVDPSGTPGAAYLVDRGAWPAGVPLPGSVRWLPAEKAGFLLRTKTPLRRGAAGALAYRFAAVGENGTAAVQLEAVDADGGAIREFWPSGPKRATLGGGGCLDGGRRVFAARPAAHRDAGVILTEGPLDGLGIVHLTRLGAACGMDADAAVIASAGTSGWGPAVVEGCPGPVVLAAQADGTPGFEVAMLCRGKLLTADRTVRVEQAPLGMDWADVAAAEVAEREAVRAEATGDPSSPEGDARRLRVLEVHLAELAGTAPARGSKWRSNG